MKKVLIFLDIDGVLNNEETGTIYTVVNSEKDYQIDWTGSWQNLIRLIGSLGDFVGDENVKVVIHSGWIKHKEDPDYVWEYYDKKLHSLFQYVKCGLADYYLDCVDYYPHTSKKFKILKWLEKHPEYNDWIKFVLDDDVSPRNELTQLPNEVKNMFFCIVNPKYGLQQQTVDNILKVVQFS